MSGACSGAGEQGVDDSAHLRGIVLIESAAGRDASGYARRLETDLAARGVPVMNWPPAHPRHPVAFENVSLVSPAVLAHLRERDADAWHELRAHAERYPDGWIIRHTDQLDVPAEIAEQVRRLDAYEGEVTADAHARALVESWRRFGAQTPSRGVHIWEGALLRSSRRALIGRFGVSSAALGAHVRALIAAVRPHRPVVVYLDAPGDGRAGDGGARQRRDLDVEVIAGLDVPTIVVPVTDGQQDDTARRVVAFVDDALRG